ncbi:MAG: response regulator [Actinobacteria bacterium]|nr:response regulator [Actinomycetota bacterium]
MTGHKAGPEDSREATRPRVLVVDDDPDMLQVARRGLESEYEIVDASTGAGGVEVAKRVKPDAIVLDLDLPDISGFDVMKLMREKIGTSVPIIILTGSTEEDAEFISAQAGADDFISKPYDMERLKARIALNLLKRGLRA